MAEFGLGPEVRRIIAANLATMDNVELLLLLHKGRSRIPEPQGMVCETERPMGLIVTALADLTSGGLVSQAAGPAPDRGSARIG